MFSTKLFKLSYKDDSIHFISIKACNYGQLKLKVLTKRVLKGKES